MKILKINKNNKSDILNEAFSVFKSGGLVIYPTETCYGAGVLATNEKAVKKLLRYKNRPSGKPISIAVASESDANKYANLNDQALAVYKRFLPGPVTVISKYSGGLASGLVSEYGTIGIRIPDYKFVLNLLGLLDGPITATSANSSGKKTPYTIKDIFSNLTDKQKELIDLVIDAGELPANPPSTVIDTTKEDMMVIRSGSLNIKEKFEKIIINTESEMRELGKNIVKINEKAIEDKGLLILFNAELGAGKTQMVKGIADALGIDEIVKSPTYSLIEEYTGTNGNLVHIDAWRLENIAEFHQLNIKKFATPNNVIAVEWSGGAEGSLKDLSTESGLNLITIDISYLDEKTREVSIVYS